MQLLSRNTESIDDGLPGTQATTGNGYFGADRVGPRHFVRALSSGLPVFIALRNEASVVSQIDIHDTFLLTRNSPRDSVRLLRPIRFLSLWPSHALKA
jgi:hypothetical protein